MVTPLVTERCTASHSDDWHCQLPLGHPGKHVFVRDAGASEALIEPDDAGAATALASPEVREALVVATSILDDEEIGRLWRLANPGCSRARRMSRSPRSRRSRRS
jgi:hypothetical protein